jgi:hypothetical protein
MKIFFNTLRIIALSLSEMPYLLSRLPPSGQGVKRGSEAKILTLERIFADGLNIIIRGTMKKYGGS